MQVIQIACKVIREIPKNVLEGLKFSFKLLAETVVLIMVYFFISNTYRHNYLTKHCKQN